MSWQDDIKKYPTVPITTGDGITYQVKLIFKGGGIDPLTAVYSYPGKRGSKPKRNSSASPVYDLEFFVLQDQFNNFKASVQNFDSEWLVEHPLYGDLNGHPTDFSWDNTEFGEVNVKVQFQESIDDSIE